MSIWRFGVIEPEIEKIPEEYRITADEGDTPLHHYTSDEVQMILKREDLNPTGSHKDRGIAYQIAYHLNEGAKHFVISSSGNSSISAVNLLRNREVQLDLFLPEGLNDSKEARLSKLLNGATNIQIHYSKRAKKDAIQFAKSSGGILLRGSTDRTGTIGYRTIAYELHKQSQESTDIFIPTSSGTTLVGIYEGYSRLLDRGEISSMPRIHACQTTKIHTFAKYFDSSFTPTESSIVTSIVDRVGHRKNEVLKALEESNGKGWIVGDDLIQMEFEKLHENQFTLSHESALAVAAAKSAAEVYEMHRPIILATGTE